VGGNIKALLMEERAFGWFSKGTDIEQGLTVFRLSRFLPPLPPGEGRGEGIKLNRWIYIHIQLLIALYDAAYFN